MSLIDYFVVIYPYLCLIIINSAILAVLLPNQIINTASTRCNWLVVGLIVSGLAGLRSGTYTLPISLFLLSIVVIACVIHLIKTKHPKAQSLPAQPAEFLKRIK